jgi:hypothetical protein
MSKPSQQAHTRPIAEALGANAVLGRLLERLRESQARLATVLSVLPPAMRRHVRPGVLDDEGWNLLVPNGAVAAKLRQSLPLIEQVLVEQGWPPLPVRVKVQSDAA